MFTRKTEEADPTKGINVALVDVRSGVIGDDGGTRPTTAADEHVSVRKP